MKKRMTDQERVKYLEKALECIAGWDDDMGSMRDVHCISCFAEGVLNNAWSGNTSVGSREYTVQKVAKYNVERAREVGLRYYSTKRAKGYRWNS